jgi:hypothetical protein
MVMVATPLDVGRTGMTKSGSVEVGEEMGPVERGTHDEGPHSRSVGQQPPPRFAAQARKPDEHGNAVEEVDGGVVVGIGKINVDDDGDGATLRDIDEVAKELVVEGCKPDVVEKRERVTVGVTTTVIVDMTAPVEGESAIADSTLGENSYSRHQHIHIQVCNSLPRSWQDSWCTHLGSPQVLASMSVLRYSIPHLRAQYRTLIDKLLLPDSSCWADLFRCN